VGASALAATLIGRLATRSPPPSHTVVLVVAAVSPQHAWQQPILRLADTVIGVAVGVAAAWLEFAWQLSGQGRPRSPAGR